MRLATHASRLGEANATTLNRAHKPIFGATRKNGKRNGKRNDVKKFLLDTRWRRKHDDKLAIVLKVKKRDWG